MNLETVVRIVNHLVFAQTGRQLKEVEKLIVQGAWEAKTYSQIAENCKYSLGYIKQAAAPRLWKLLSEILEEDISKTNFRVVIERQKQHQIKSSLAEVGTNQSGKITNSSIDWHQIPKINPCYGRTQELALLTKWLLEDRCRLIGIVGMGGVGKTTLAVSCVEKIRDEFEVVIWRELRDGTSIGEVIVKLIQLIFPQPNLDLPDNIDALISILLDILLEHRCLIVFDTTTAISQTALVAGNERSPGRDYGKLLKRLGAELHQSCLLFLAREKPREVALLEGAERPVRCLSLKGLSSEAKEILKAKKLLDPDRWDELIQIYRGNPLALKIIAHTIEELFGGKVAAFLRQQTIVFGELNDLLDEQFECLSVLQTEILDRLAIKEHPLSLSQLSSGSILIGSQAELMEALESLLRRSLITRELVEEEIMFSLPQPIVRQYIIEQICEQICQEIQKVSTSQKVEQLQLLRTLPLTNNLVDNSPDRETKKPLIIQLIVNRLCRIIRDERLVAEKLTSILSLVVDKTFLVVGYTKHNLEQLLAELQFNFNYVVNSMPPTKK